MEVQVTRTPPVCVKERSLSVIEEHPQDKLSAKVDAKEEKVLVTP